MQLYNSIDSKILKSNLVAEPFIRKTISQMSVPEANFEAFLQSLKNFPIFDGIPIKYAIEDNGKSL